MGWVGGWGWYMMDKGNQRKSLKLQLQDRPDRQGYGLSPYYLNAIQRKNYRELYPELYRGDRIFVRDKIRLHFLIFEYILKFVLIFNLLVIFEQKSSYFFHSNLIEYVLIIVKISEYF